MKINTLLFDLDGTLIDTNTLIFESFKHTFATHFKDVVLSDEDLLSFIGPSLHDTFSKYTTDQLDEVIATYRKFNIDKHPDYVKIFPHVKEVLTILRDRGYNMAIVTTKMEDVATLGLELMEIKEFFDVVIGFTSIKNPKPDPESIYKALSNFNNVDGAIMIGDNVSDILAGQNAKILTAGVAWSLKGEEELKSVNPDYILNDFKDLLTILEEE